MKTSIAIFATLLIAIGYAKTSKPEDLPADSVFLKGEQFYSEGNYRKAVTYLDYFILNYPVKVEVALAQYHLADSYFNLKKYEDASVEYEFLYKQFPSSPFAEEAMIKAAQSTFEISEPYYREQNITLDAQRMTKDFIQDYPKSDFVPEAKALLVSIDEKLARKELEAAELYFKFKEYNAAVMSLEYIIASYPLARETNLETSYYLGLCKAKLEDVDEAQAIFEELLENPIWNKKAQKALDRLEKGK